MNRPGAVHNAALATLTYTGNPNFNGVDKLVITAVDDGGLQASQSLDVVVNPDNRALTVTGTVVNEASPYVVFTVTGVAGSSGQLVGLTLGTTGSGTGHATLGADVQSSLEYFNGTAWTAYTGSPVAIPNGGTTLLVRAPVVQDSADEGAETFKLTVSNVAGTTYSGNSTIKDDGTGVEFLANNNTGTGTILSTPDDDRALTVSSILVNEASPYAVFQLSGMAGQSVTLALINGTATDADHGTIIQYYDGTGWQTYSAAFGLPFATTLVRTSVTPDADYEGAETYALRATNGSGRAFVGTATILDTGLGSIYPNNTTGATDGAAAKDDDRTLAVTSPTVNEASPYAVFTVSGPAGHAVSLTLGSGTATGIGTDYGAAGGTNLQYSLDDGNTWSSYSTAITLPEGGYFRVRTPVVDDNLFDNGETFNLTAVIAGGATATGVATINDQGGGVIYFPDGSVNLGAAKTTDGPLLTYNGTTYTEAVGNDGSVSTSITITLTGDTYTADVVSASKIVATNVPAGLVANFVRTSATVITATLTGSATAHANANDISNLTFTFQNGAFAATATASNVTGYQKNNLVVDFADPTLVKSVSYSAATFTEAVANNGSIGSSITVTLTNETFTGIDGQLLPGVTVNNLPTGLTAVVTRVDATHAAVTLTGNATAHANANDISNLTIAFGDAAFTGNNASLVTNATKSNLVVDFADPAPVAPPAPVFEPEPSPPSQSGGFLDDGDGISDSIEAGVPQLNVPGAVFGDGNGDGVIDNSQKSVSSTPFRDTPTVSIQPNADPVFVTLVAGSADGKVPEPRTTITRLQQKDAPADMPNGLIAPVGVVSFEAKTGLANGSKDTFSFYVDPSLGINGYWVQDASGTWINLASAAYGGNMIMEGRQLRLDFVIQDGGLFDADGLANGSISNTAVAGFMSQSITEHHPHVVVSENFWF